MKLILEIGNIYLLFYDNEYGLAVYHWGIKNNESGEFILKMPPYGYSLNSHSYVPYMNNSLFGSYYKYKESHDPDDDAMMIYNCLYDEQTKITVSRI